MNELQEVLSLCDELLSVFMRSYGFTRFAQNINNGLNFLGTEFIMKELKNESSVMTNDSTVVGTTLKNKEVSLQYNVSAVLPIHECIKSVVEITRPIWQNPPQSRLNSYHDFWHHRDDIVN